MSGAAQFVCNVCGGACAGTAEAPGRETEDCACGSTVRLRGLVALLSRELFGVALALPDFPRLKGVRGVGLSDPPAVASRLAERLDYTNTFYHQEPRLDVTSPAESDYGRYDFIVSSEVMEHVPAPVERAFANLCRLLKPDGFLALTVPYRLQGVTEEHFPQLHEYTVTSVGGRAVLLNRRRDGAVEIFENLCFHGGDGSTLEMRVFSETSLKAALAAAGFAEVEIAAEDVPEFGVRHNETWSLPVVARRGRFRPPVGELGAAYREACRRTSALQGELTEAQAELSRVHTKRVDLERQLVERVEWVRKVEADFEERTKWALELDREKEAAEAELARARASAAEAWRRVAELERQFGEANAARAVLESRLWTRVGRKLRLA